MADYRVRVRGPGGMLGADVVLECDSDDQALVIACNIGSPYGHELHVGDRLLGLFEAGWGTGLSTDDAGD